jgi:nicotinate dehydrogenase subunit A
LAHLSVPARPDVQPVTLHVNGRVEVLAVDGGAPLLAVLRNDLGLNGPKYGCGLGECGSCTVLVDGVAARACVLPLAGVAGREVTTLEGLASAGRLHPVQQAFIDCHGLQCGFCTPGMIMASVALLQRTPQPSQEQIEHALEGNLCRCTGYVNIVAAVKQAATTMAGATK